jgi:hypothetical protein
MRHTPLQESSPAPEAGCGAVYYFFIAILREGCLLNGKAIAIVKADDAFCITYPLFGFDPERIRIAETRAVGDPSTGVGASKENRWSVKG